MAANVVRATLLADAQRFKAGFREAEQATGKFEKKTESASKFIKGALVGVAAVAVKSFVDDSVRAFSELEQSIGGTAAVFGDSSGAIDDFAVRSSRAIGLSESEFRTATTSIGGQLKRMTGDVDFAAEHSIIATQVAADLAATYGGTTAEAVLALGSAFRGEADPAERFNLNLKVGAVNAKAVEMGLAASTTEVDENAKAQATLALIMEQSADAQGQFAREADTAAGATQRANARIEDNKALIGSSFQGLYKNAITSVAALTGWLAVGATKWAELTGQMEAGDGALRRWIITAGDVPQNMQDIIALIESEGWRKGWTPEGVTDSLKDIENGTRDLLIEMGLSSEEMVSWQQNAGAVAQQAGFTTEEMGALEEGIREARIAAKQQEDQLAENKLRMEAMGQATEDATGAQRDLTEATQTYIDKLRETVDPVFAAMNAVNSLKDAQAHLIEVQDDSEASAGDLAQAELDVAEALLDAQGAMDSLDSKTLNASIGAIAEILGKSKDEVILLLQQLDLLDGRTVNTFIDTHRRTFTGRGGVQEFAGGGVVEGPEGQPQLAVVHGGEEVITAAERRSGERRSADGGGQIPFGDLAEILLEQTLLLRQLVQSNRDGTRVFLDGRAIAESVRVWNRTLRP